MFRDPARESEAPPEMAIGLALAALAFDAEEAEKLEVEVALAGLAGFDEQLVDATIIWTSPAGDPKRPRPATVWISSQSVVPCARSTR